MRAMLTLLTLLGLQAGASAAPPAEKLPRVTDPEEAAAQVSLEVMMWDSRRRDCAKLLPEEAQGISALYLHWLGENSAPVRGLLAYAEHSKKGIVPFSVLHEGLPGGGLEEEAAGYNLAPRDFCMRMFTSLKAGDFDIGKAYPDVAEVLAKYLGGHPLSTQAARAYDGPIGCMKAAVNKNLDYDAAKPSCRCLWETMNKEFTAAEWTEYEAAVSGGKREQVEALPQYQRLTPKLAACAKLLPQK